MKTEDEKEVVDDFNISRELADMVIADAQALWSKYLDHLIKTGLFNPQQTDRISYIAALRIGISIHAHIWAAMSQIAAEHAGRNPLDLFNESAASVATQLFQMTATQLGHPPAVEQVEEGGTILGPARGSGLKVPGGFGIKFADPAVNPTGFLEFGMSAFTLVLNHMLDTAKEKDVLGPLVIAFSGLMGTCAFLDPFLEAASPTYKALPVEDQGLVMMLLGMQLMVNGPLQDDDEETFMMWLNTALAVRDMLDQHHIPEMLTHVEGQHA